MNKTKLMIVFGVLMLLVIGGWVAYTTVPKIIIGKALMKFGKYKSLKVEYIAPNGYDKQVKAWAQINTDGKELSRVVVDVGGTAKVDLLVNSKNFYGQVTTPQIDEAEKSLKLTYPAVLEMETYKLVKPIVAGEAYLHIDIPEATDSATIVKELTKSEKELSKSWGSIYFWRSINPFYKYNGESVTRIVVGIRKDKLLQAIDKIKDSDLDVKVSQINAAKKVVEATNSWDKDIIEIIVDRSDNLRAVMIKLPQPPKDALKDNLAEGMQSTNVTLVSGLQNFVAKYVPAETKLVDLGGIYFSDFDKEMKVSTPEKLVEINKIIEVGQKEIMPMIGAALMGKPIPMPTPKKTVAPVAKKRVLSASCPAIYTITGGSIKGERCYSQNDAMELDKLIKEENSVVAGASAQLKTLQSKCQSGDQGACSEGESLYNQTMAKINGLEQQVKTVFARGW